MGLTADDVAQLVDNMVVTRTMLSRITPQSFDLSGPFMGQMKSCLKILLSRACDITSLAEKDLDLSTRDVKLVSDVKILIKEIANLKLNPWPRCIIPQKNKSWKILVACDGSTMASSATIYFLSTPVETGPKECNMARTSSLISRFFYLFCFLPGDEELGFRKRNVLWKRS